MSAAGTDWASGTLVYDAVGLPPGLQISTGNGTISGTVAAGASANSPYTITVAAKDGTYHAQTSFTWNVSSPVSFTNPPGDQTNNVGDCVNLSVAATDSISGHATLSYSATTPLPPGLSINSSTGAITGRLTEGGDWETVITVTDRTYSNTDDFDWTVNSPITITDQGDQTNGIGDAVSVQISATDTACGTLKYTETGLPPG